MRVSVLGSEGARARVRGQGEPAGAAAPAMPPHPGILLLLPWRCPACAPRGRGLWHPWVPSMGAAPVPPQYLPPLRPRAGAGTCSLQREAGRRHPRHRLLPSPQPAESGCFPVCLLPFAPLPGTGDSDRQAAVPAGARSQPLPTPTPGVLPPGAFQGSHLPDSLSPGAAGALHPAVLCCQVCTDTAQRGWG